MANTWTQEQRIGAIRLCGWMGFKFAGKPAIDLACQRNELLEALKLAELAEGRLINEWADFWDVAPQPLINALLEAQTKRNFAIARAEAVNV